MIIIKAIIKRIDLPTDKRTIVISDIHGSLELFQRLLDKINYSDNDTLILLGDIIEKGNKSLATLRYIMELSQKSTVHIVTGNCDTIWEDIMYDSDNQSLLRYMILRKKSILNEMCDELSIKVNEESDINYIKKQLLDNFSDEFNWLAKLPHIIETKNFIFAHGGITTERLEDNDSYDVIKNFAFMEKGLSFSKYVIVGHWPTTNYCREKGCHNPIVNAKQKIISIDGGNVIRKCGQLNAMIINKCSVENIEFYAVDNLQKGIIIEDQSSNLSSININFDDSLVDVLEEKGESSLCRHISSKYEFWINSNTLYTAKDGVHCYDYTNYILPVTKGDIVSIVERTEKQTLVKKAGVVGWVSNEKLQNYI